MIKEISLDGFQTAHFTEHSSLAERRIVLGLTQKQVADRAKMPLSSYQRFESGDRKLSTATFNIACRVLEALELDIAAFYHGDWVFGEPWVETKDGLCYKSGGRPVGVDVTEESQNQ